MNNSQFGHDKVPVASLVKSGKPKISTVCWVSLILGGFALVCFCLLAAAIYFVVAPISNSSTNEQYAFSPEALEAELFKDFQYAKNAFDNANDPRTHPQYKRVEQFVSAMSSVLDNTPNKRLQRIVDYDRHFEEICRHTGEIYNNRLSRNIYIPQFQTTLVGPIPFSEFELIQIDDIAPNEFRVVLSYDVGFNSDDPHVWWLIDDQGKLKLYDWQELDYGFRDSAETGIYISAPMTESDGYDRYSENAQAYYSSYDSDWSYTENQRKSLELLAKCENYQGPPQLEPSSHFNTASLWHDEGQQQRAIKLLDSVALSKLSPGIDRLKGDIYFSQNRFEKALTHYQKYASIMGHTPHVRDNMASSFMDLGDEVSERALREKRLDRINVNAVDNLAHLMEINDRSQNTELFSQIDAADDRNEIYSGLAQWFGSSVYFADQFDQLKSHLAETAPGSEALIEAMLQSDQSVADYLKVLEMIESYTGENTDSLRSQFWYHVPEQQAAKIFESGANKTANMKTISEIQNGDYIFDDDRMIEICKLAIQADAKNFYAHYQLGSAQVDKKKYETAVEHLEQALTLVPDESDWESTIRYSLMRCFYQSGDHKKALEFAQKHDMAIQFLYLKNSDKDFSNFGSLLNQLTLEKDQREYQTALWEAHQGNTGNAILRFAQIINEQDETNYNAYEYECQTKLIELCKETGDVAQLVQLVPDEEFWQRLMSELVQESNWSLCQQLLRSSDPKFADHRFKLAQMIAWEKGDYKKIVADAGRIISMAARKDMSQELNWLVRSALRMGNLTKAQTLATRAAGVGLSPKVSALVAIRRHRLDESLEMLFEMPRYTRTDLLFDDDVRRSDLKQLAQIEELSSWECGSYTYRDAQLTISLLLNDKTTIDQNFIKQKLANVISGDAEVEKMSDPESKAKTWRFEFPNWEIYATLEPIPPQSFDDDDYSSDDFKESVKRSSTRLKLTGFAKTAISNFTNKSTTCSIVESFLDAEFLLASSSDNYWLSAAQIKKHLEKSETADKVLLPFRSGEYGYLEEPDDTDESSEERRKQFEKEFAATIKHFVDSPDPKKRLRISLGTSYDFVTPIVADVQRIKRTSYGAIDLVVVVQPNDESRIPGGISIEVPTWNVNQFDLQTSESTISKTR